MFFFFSSERVNKQWHMPSAVEYVSVLFIISPAVWRSDDDDSATNGAVRNQNIIISRRT